ncbi:hypothetical protein Godav_025559 [Gossypium davidsonii]|uniref:Uncharacterized protein n=1 Tax=Gossypium davidsonii TaxID=34287 RepID=A0A7J8T807_GOSDV|nr:hypothetical protein [Gossypium davidsonii]
MLSFGTFWMVRFSYKDEGMIECWFKLIA